MFKRFYKHILIVFSISLMIILISINLAIPQNQPSFISINPDSNRVSGSNWAPGTVTIDFYDQENGSLLYQTLANIDGGGNFDFWLDDFDIQPGHFVTATTDGTDIKTLVVTSLAIDEINWVADTVSGTAEPNAEIRVDGGTPEEPTSGNATAGAGGNWTVDFTVTQPTWDLVPGSDCRASEVDDDCDETSVWGHLPLPWFQVNHVLNRVLGNEWIYANTASIYIGDWRRENVVIDEGGNFDIWLEEDFDIQIGHFVTVTDGITTKEHVVTTLTVDKVNLADDTVSGTAEHPNAEIRVDSSDPEEPNCRTGTANEEGKWTVDFKVTQPGCPTWDIVEESAGRACERDADGDETLVPWPLPNEPPVAVCKNIEIPADENSEAHIIPGDIDGGSYDPDGDAITLSVDNSGPFSLGEHSVNLTVTDDNGASDSCQAQVTVVDITPPEISVSVSPNTLWPPNHKMVLITLIIVANDNCDPPPAVQLTSITMNEGDETNAYDPNYDSTVGDGHTIDDIQVYENGDIYLRAERSGTGTGRIYTITYIATDASGNTATASAIVTVPHNQ